MMISIQYGLLSVLLAASCILPGTAAAQDWEWQNPTPHGHTINDIVIADDGWSYAVCDNGYIMRSGNGGKTWDTRSWTFVDLQTIIHAGNGVLLATGDRQKILRSTDFGMSWTNVHNTVTTSSGYSDIVRTPAGVLLAVLSSNLMLRSDDQGITWDYLNVPFQPNESVRSLGIRSSDIWWAISNRVVYKTADAGNTWIEDTTYNARGLQRFVFVNSEYGYQLRDGQLLRTEDGGGTWTEMDIFGFDTNIDLEVGDTLGQVVYCMSAGSYIVNKSTDGGDTWNVSLTGTAFPEAYPSGMSFLNERMGLVAGDGGRILRTEDGGASWSIVHGLGFIGSISDLVFTTTDIGIAMTYSPTVLISSNGGRRWDEVVPDATFALRKITMVDRTEGFAFASNSSYRYAIFHTSDAGVNWDKRSTLPLSDDVLRTIQPQGIHAVSRDTVWIGASYGHAYRSTDGGVNWDSLYITPQLESQYSSGNRIYSFPPSTVVYVSTSGLAVSNDAGITWEYRPGPFNRYMQQVEFLSNDIAFASFSGAIGRTTNGGISWDLDYSYNVELLHFFDASNGITFDQRYGNEDGAVVRKTSDGGFSWEEFRLRETTSWSDWFFISPEEGWAFGFGGMIRHNSIGGVVETGGQVEMQPTFYLDQNYPNPFSLSRNGATTLHFSIPPTAGGRVSLTLYDQLGKEITRIVDGQLPPGRHYAVFHPGTDMDLSSGTYLWRLSTTAGVLTKSMIVLR